MPILGTVFPAAAGMGLIIGMINLWAWQRGPNRPSFLFGALMGLAAAATALGEASYLQQISPEHLQWLTGIQTIFVGIMIVSMVWFVRARVSAGRVWLAWAITAAWLASWVVSVLTPGNVVFTSVQSVTWHETPWGEGFSVPIATANPWSALPNIASLGLAYFTLEAFITLYREGRRHEAWSVCAPILFFIVVAGIHTPLVDFGILPTPYMVSLVFVAIAISQAADLVDDVAKGSSLAEKLKVERRRWSLLTEGIDLAVVRVDAEGKLDYANSFLRTLTGKSPEDIAGQDPASLMSESAPGEIASLAKTSDTWSSRARVQRDVQGADGETRHFLWFSTALQDVSGAPDGLISIGQDITERLALEAEREHQRKETERMMRAMTLGEMASAFSHELSQPIAAVLSSAQTLEMDWNKKDEESQRKLAILQRIIRNTRRARDLMRQVRIYMFDLPPEVSEFSFTKLIDEAIDAVRTDAIAAKVHIEKAPSGEDILVRASAIEIQQLISNLLQNAIHATSAVENGLVRIGWKTEEAADLIIIVEDNGPGIEAAQIARVFEPFYTSTKGGIGLGLALVKRIVTRHGGLIEVSSGQLGGARFNVVVPIVVSQRERLYG